MRVTSLPEHYCEHLEKKLLGKIIENVFEPQLFASIKNYITSLYKDGDTKSFGKHNTIINFDNKKIKLGQSLQNNREIFLLHDTTSSKEYYYQSNETVRDYAYNYLRHTAHPSLVKSIYTLGEILEGDIKDYVPMRSHINWTPYEKLLTLHFDTDPSWWSTKTQAEARCFSFTVYLNSITRGGQFWTSTGFVYTPVENSAILINGNSIMHGINQNRDEFKRDRMAFTVRFAHKDDLFLPGSPEKRLYSVEDFIK